MRALAVLCLAVGCAAEVVPYDKPPPLVLVAKPEPVVVEPSPSPPPTYTGISLGRRGIVFGAPITDPALAMSLEGRARLLRAPRPRPYFWPNAEGILYTRGEQLERPIALTLLGPDDEVCVTRATRRAFVKVQLMSDPRAPFDTLPFRIAYEIEGCRDFFGYESWIAVEGPREGVVYPGTTSATPAMNVVEFVCPA